MHVCKMLMNRQLGRKWIRRMAERQIVGRGQHVALELGQKLGDECGQWQEHQIALESVQARQEVRNEWSRTSPEG
jgi:hypothetical protein